MKIFLHLEHQCIVSFLGYTLLQFPEFVFATYDCFKRYLNGQRRKDKDTVESNNEYTGHLRQGHYLKNTNRELGNHAANELIPQSKSRIKDTVVANKENDTCVDIGKIKQMMLEMENRISSRIEKNMNET